MSSTNDANDATELCGKIQQFLSQQIESGNLSEAAKESLTVASECITQAYNIPSRPASRELLDIYTSHKQQANSRPNAAGGNAPAPNPASILQGLATSFLGSAGNGGLFGGQGATPATTTNTNAQQQATPGQNQESPRPSAPRARKQATDAEKMAAESFKNQGNDYMKQNMLKEAYDSYSKAIEIDDNNAIYYSNRAAASSKMGDHHAALRDCEEAVEIDPTYSKAYGRMGLAYASMENHQKAKEAYVKAVELDPSNESYRNNLKIAEEKLAEMQQTGGAGAGGQGQIGDMLRNMMSNPEVMRMALNSLQDPRMQNLFGLGGSQQQQPATAQNAGHQQTGANTNSNPQDTPNSQDQPRQAFNPADLLNLAGRLSGGQNPVDLLGAGQQLLSSLQGSNPELVENMRRMMNQAFTPPQNDNNQNDRNPPPGYS